MTDGGSVLGEDISSPAGFTRFENATVGALYMLFCIVGVTTNFLTALTFYKDTKLLTNSKPWLHICLSVANMAVVAPSPFPASSSFSGRWLYGNTMCQAYAFEGMFVGIVAIGTVIALSIERYIVATKANASESNRVKEDGTDWFYTWAILLVVGNGFFWAVMPLLGWSKYTIEHSGTSCAIDWKNPDESYISYILSLEIFSFSLPMAVGFLCLYVASGQSKSHQVGAPTGGEGSSSSQAELSIDQRTVAFSENQLQSLCYVFILLVLIGWGPFAFLCTSTMLGGARGLSMLAASIPPLACKCMVSAYPLAYAVTSPRFRHSFMAVLGGSEKKQD
ncbi:unnamed protein product [Lymnaea stagnalis]|uniref:G-protein coupled receptors family 1 profile domain-containing protein n=1 Tax=Lymnaea stagnalis TaxID=6523 RepID=A0AAV2HDJ3_LYMST